MALGLDLCACFHMLSALPSNRWMNGQARKLNLIGSKSAFVGYCHVDEGCKPALPKTISTNGIASASNGTIYVANSITGVVEVLERQSDNTLVTTDSIKTGELLYDEIVFRSGTE